jgi:hypothetical protein
MYDKAGFWKLYKLNEAKWRSQCEGKTPLLLYAEGGFNIYKNVHARTACVCIHNTQNLINTHVRYVFEDPRLVNICFW